MIKLKQSQWQKTSIFNSIIQVNPLWVHFKNEVKFPFSASRLYSLFFNYGFFYILKTIVVKKNVTIIFRCETFRVNFIFVFLYSSL